MNQKRCSRCEQWKDKNEFHKDNRRKDKLFIQCKACRREYANRLWTKQLRYRANCRYYKTPHGRTSKQEYERGAKERHPRRVIARSKISQAVASGKLPHIGTQKCVDCEHVAQNYHHRSYEPEHWFDVTPLCRQCHIRKHINDYQRNF